MDVAKAVREVVGGRVVHTGRGPFDTHEVIADDGRRWRVMADSSLSAPRALQVEVVSPILHYRDIEPLQEPRIASLSVGPEFKTARHHLLRNLGGYSAAWKGARRDRASRNTASQEGCAQ